MSSCCGGSKKNTGFKSVDWIFWASLFAVATLMGLYYGADYLPYISTSEGAWLYHAAHHGTDLMNQMWIGLAIGVLFVGIIGNIPRDIIVGFLGNKSGFNGLFRATMAGVLLDMCSHGILMVGAKLYERGVSAGQVMAFLIASPWNSFSLMIILWALLGWQWTLAFLVLSMVIGMITGAIFQYLVAKGTLPKNPNTVVLPEGFDVKNAALAYWRTAEKNHKSAFRIAKEGVLGSKVVVKWLLFGIVLSVLLNLLIDPEVFKTYFGPTMVGLLLTSIFATIIEVCSEGSVPIAADLMNSAKAPGNSFSFLMTGVSTDYTEVMILRETTKSWKIALFLPLITLPQILILAFVLNLFGG